MKYSNDELIRMYGQMVLGRKYVEKILSLVAQGKLMGFFHLGFGQEAIGIGIINAMGPGDYLVPTHRQQAVMVNKLDINRFTAELMGRTTGYCRGKGFEFHISSQEERMFPVSAVLGSGAPLGVGAAMAIKLDRKDGVVVCCCGDGATSEGNVHEAMNLASVMKLPIVFVIENNGWAISHPVERQCNVPNLSVRAEGYGMTGVTVDGTDVVLVRETMERAIEQARRGQPNIVELKVVRWRGHFEGDPQVYRDLREVEAAKKDDCIARFAKLLQEKGILTISAIESIDAEMKKRVEDAFAYAQDCPMPTPEETLDCSQVYAGTVGGVMQ